MQRKDGPYIRLGWLPSVLGLACVPTLTWVWRTVESNHLSSICVPDPHYLGLGTPPSLNALGPTYMVDLHYLELGALLCSNVLSVARCRTHATLDLADCQVQAPWVWYICQPTLPWIWRTAMFKSLGCDMRVRTTLPWAWCTAKPIRLGLGWMPSPNALGLAYVLDPHYLRLGWLASPNTLGPTCVPDPHYLGFNVLTCPNTLDMAGSQVQMSWVSYVCQIHMF
jgi:hypothetical protein